MSAWQSLIELLTVEQREQLAELIIRQMGIGYGWIEIEIEDHHLKYFYVKTGVSARRESDIGSDKPL
jgi:hypothetical protein